MTLNVNGTAMSLVNVNGTRMQVVNVNGTEVYRAENGDVTMIYTGGPSGSFSPGAEDENRHFVYVGLRFSGSALGSPTTPTINGTTPTTIITAVGNGGGDGGMVGIYTIKIPTGTANISFSQGGNAFTYAAIYRVTGCVSMTSALAASSGGGTYGSSANGCFFGASVSNFSLPPSFPSPNSSGLLVTFNAADGGRIAASNTTTGPTQSVSLSGNQINCGATFGYDLF
jgi:hypothetical protein